MTSPTIITRCRVCGRRLTHPDSVKRGVGPVCWRRLERIQELDYFQAVSPSKDGYAVDEGVAVHISFKWDLPTCPGCGNVSPNPRYCVWCGGPIMARPMEVVA